MTQQTPPPDTLTTQIGVLTRREVEARILKPIIEALSEPGKLPCHLDQPKQEASDS